MSRVPWARCQQEGSNSEDDQLTTLARTRRPKVQHWWGRQHWYDIVTGDRPTEYAIEVGPCHYQAYRNGAWCYVCDKPIATWSSRWPMTAGAKALVELHRRDHIQGRLDLTPAQEDKR